MLSESEVFIEPKHEIVALVGKWLVPVRAALGDEFASAYLTGSVLT